MINFKKLVACSSIVVLGLFVQPHLLEAAILGSGNIIVSDSDSNSIIEYTTAGSLVQSFSITTPTGVNVPRGVKVDGDGNLRIYNGTFTPVLTTIEASSGTQTDFTGNFGTNNNSTFGSIAVAGSSVLVTDLPVGSRTETGVLRFNGSTTDRFISDFSATDMTIGQDGLLTVLGATTSTGALNPNVIRKYDALTGDQISEILLPSTTSSESLRGIVADDSGRFFAHAFDDSVFELDAAGNIVNTLGLTNAGERLVDIDIDTRGNIVLGSDRGNVFLTDTDLISASSFAASTSTNTVRPVYVGFTSPAVVVPEPSSTIALLGAAGWFAVRRRTKKRRT